MLARFGWLPILLGFLQAVGPISTDMYLPAFPAMEASFHTLPGSAQITLGAWVLGLSAGQLIQGALSDRFGRRGPLLAGTLLYTLGAIACALSTGMVVMAGWRFITAVGASASMVIPRAIVRDVAHGHEAARLMSRLILVLGAAPILAPSLGGLILHWASWRWIFWITVAYGVLAISLAGAYLPDTLPHADRVRLAPRALLRRYGHVLGERGFTTHALMMACYAFGLFAYLGGSPTVFIDHYHFTPGEYAVVFGAVAGTYILCSQLNMRLVRRFDLHGTLRHVSLLYLLLASLLVLLAARDAPALWFGVVLALTHGLNGFLAPTATVGALRHHGAQAGIASALLGTVQYGVGATGGFVVGWLTDGTAMPMAGLMLCAALAGKIADLARPKESKEALLF